MVIRDPHIDKTVEVTPGPAPYLDRFFANLIDALVLFPLISLFGSGITNDLRWAIFSRSTTGVYALLAQYLFIGFALFVLYEVLFIYFHGATPGHHFLQLKVSTEDGSRPTFFQILFRSVFKFQAIVLGCIPFIEIAVRDDRSTFYDRLSQTQITSLKSIQYDQIHPEFRKIVSRWAYSLIALVFVLVGIGFYNVVTQSPESITKKKSAEAHACNETLNFYVKSYLAKSKESESLKCSRDLVKRSIDSEKAPSSFNYLVQYVVTANNDLKDSYKMKYCGANSDRLVCRTDVAIDFDSVKPDDEDVVNLLVDLNVALQKENHVRVFTILDILYTHVDWNKNLELYYLTSYIFMNEMSSRGPASAVAKNEMATKLWEAQKRRFLKRMSVFQ